MFSAFSSFFFVSFRFFFLFFLCSAISFGYSYLFLYLFSCLFSFSLVAGCFPWVVFCVDSGWVFDFVFVRLILSLFLFFFCFSPCGQRGVGGCNFSFGGRFGRCIFTEFFSIVTVPEIHWLLSDLLAFSDNDNIFFSFLSFCLRSHDPVFFPWILSHDICCILQATMNWSLPFFVGYSGNVQVGLSTQRLTFSYF